MMLLRYLNYVLRQMPYLLFNGLDNSFMSHFPDSSELHI